VRENELHHFPILEMAREFFGDFSTSFFYFFFFTSLLFSDGKRIFSPLTILYFNT